LTRALKVTLVTYYYTLTTPLTISPFTTRLEKLNPKDFSPNLEKFEAIISSLRIGR
jgi:hypothetical protein